MNRKRILFLLKLVFSIAIAAFIYGKVVSREGADELGAQLSNLSWGWLLAAVAMQLAAICCSVLRWNKLLVGQGIHAPLRHLAGSFMIGRFFGEFAPGGWTGLNGYRLYDIAKHTGKVARSTASIGIEMVLGWLAFGVVVVGGSVFGMRFFDTLGLLLVDAVFVGLMVAAIALVSRPRLFRALAERMPAAVAGKLGTTIDAVCAYEGKGRLVTQAALLGVGTHVFRALIYVSAAHALRADLGVGEVFFGSSLQIFVTMLPVSINGIGLREATAVALYSRLGVPEATALLIPTLGFLVEVLISSLGGLVFMARRVGYAVQIDVEQPEREDHVRASAPEAEKASWPRISRGTVIGLGGGLAGGALLGLGEAAVVLHGGAGVKDWGVLAYGAAAYGLPCALMGVGLGFFLAWSGRLMRRAAVPEPRAFARTAALFASAGAFAIGAFRVRRDLFQEGFAWKSAQGLVVLIGCAIAALVLYLVLSALVRFIVARRPFSLLLRAYASPLVLAALLLGAMAGAGEHAAAAPMPSMRDRPPAPAQAGNVLFIVVDTLRADHLPLWGYGAVKTPHLDAFASDAVRFSHAFVNASWTRPSFASMLTGRYASSHQTMHKSAALPGELTTLAEAMKKGGYSTFGAVTNYNVAPFFNFHQGFDQYVYLEPDFVLGAGDTEAKLLFVQALRQGIETFRAKRGQVLPGSAYQDATVVNRHVTQFLDGKPQTPFLAFVAYMDPHDPYFPHPYDGTGYARAANQKPLAEEAAEMIRLYDGEIAFWDGEFGKLVADLKRRGLYDDMTIVVTSDHGEEFFEHGGFWHGTTLYDEQVHVPLLLKLPKNQQGGSVVSHWVESIDIMPTLLRIAGLGVPAGVQGKDLMTASDAVFAEEDHEGNDLKSLRMRRGDSELKLIESNADNPRGLLPFELYRLDQDPGEMVDVAKQDASLLTLSASRLDAHKRRAQVGKAAAAAVDVAKNAAAVEKLRALGYAGGEDQAEP
jgi:arylsulfatase A-like enzyme/uncharacterized membrane protein YbhN (UPF0104 family)